MKSDITSAKPGSFLRNLRTFTSLKNSSYRLYFFGMVGQWTSMNIQQMTNSLLIYRLTGSAVLLGTLALANSLPMLLFGIFGGAIADRLQKKYVLLIGLGSQAVVALIVALSLATGFLSSENPGSWWLLMVTSFLQGSVMGFMMPSQRAVIPEIVVKEQVTNAVALDTMGQNVLRLLAPAASGFIIDAFDFQAVFFLMTGLYLMGLVCVSFIPLTGKAVSRAANTLSDIKEGFHYFRRETIIIFILLWAFFGMGGQQIYIQLLPIFADDILKVGASGMGIWMSVMGIGALVSSLTFASLRPRRRGFTHVSGSIVQTLGTLGFALCHSWYGSLVLSFFIGLGQTTGMMMAQALLQDYSATQYRGRVFSIHVMEIGLSGMLMLPVGVLAAAIGAPWTVCGSSIFVILMGVLTLVFNVRYRRLE